MSENNNPWEGIEQFYFIWNADWSIGGAAQAAKDFVRGVESCALCDIAYSGIRQKGEWRECQASIPVPIETLYRNKVPQALSDVIDGDYPAVVAKTETGLVKVMGSDVIEGCEGDVEAFKERLAECARNL